MMRIEQRRRFFAEEIAAVAALGNPALVEALASVPRERFLPPGPWMVRSETEFGATPRRTPDSDPAWTCHNYSIAIRPERQLFNGAPALLAAAIDSLGLSPGAHVLHIGAGLGYYTAIIGHLIGAAGRVLALEIDDDLAAAARANLSSMPWVDIRHGDGSSLSGETFTAILVNAGMTHAPREWLDALEPGGRLILPLTASVGPPGAQATIGKGLLLLLSRQEAEPAFAVRPLTFVAIYSAVGIRDEAIDTLLGQALARNPFPRLKQLRLDPHDAGESCWLHTSRGCFST